MNTTLTYQTEKRKNKRNIPRPSKASTRATNQQNKSTSSINIQVVSNVKSIPKSRKERGLALALKAHPIPETCKQLAGLSTTSASTQICTRKDAEV